MDRPGQPEPSATVGQKRRLRGRDRFARSAASCGRRPGRCHVRTQPERLELLAAHCRNDPARNVCRPGRREQCLPSRVAVECRRSRQPARSPGTPDSGARRAIRRPHSRRGRGRLGCRLHHLGPDRRHHRAGRRAGRPVRGPGLYEARYCHRAHRLDRQDPAGAGRGARSAWRSPPILTRWSFTAPSASSTAASRKRTSAPRLAWCSCSPESVGTIGSRCRGTGSMTVRPVGGMMRVIAPIAVRFVLVET